MSTSGSRVTFDLEKGHVRHAGQDNARQLVVPASVFARLLAASKDEALAAARELGHVVGERVSSTKRPDTSIDEGLAAIAEELGLVGIGAVSMEKWGRAVLFVVDDAPDLRDDFFAALLEGTLSEVVTTHPVRARSLGRGGGKLRIFVGRPATAARLGRMLDEGVGWGDAIVRLHDGEANA